MPIVRVDLTNTAAGDFENEFLNQHGIGQLSADLLDNASQSTGYTLATVDGAWTNTLGGEATATAGVGNFPENVLERCYYSNNAGGAALEIGNIPQGATFSLELIGHNGTVNRGTTFTVTPSNEGSQDYNSADAATPAAAVVFTGTVGAAGTIKIEGAELDFAFYYINGFYLDVTESAPKTASVRLADLEGVDRANLAVVPWRWYDALPTDITAPTDTGTGSTDASGNMTVDIPNSTLTAGQVGYLLIDTGTLQSIHAVTVT